MRRIAYRTSMFRIFVATAALAVFLLPVFAPDARAADSRWYVGLNVPVMFIDDSESVERGEVPQLQGSIPYKADAVNSYKTGFRVSGTLGYEFGTGFRVDGEVFFARAAIGDLTYKGRTTTVPGLGTIDVPGEHPIDVSGSANQLGGMVNVWYDFNAGSRWRPYIGGGLGFVQVDWGDVEYNRNEVAQGAANQLAVLQAQAATPGFDSLPQSGPRTDPTRGHSTGHPAPGDRARTFRHRYGVRLPSRRGDGLRGDQCHYRPVRLPPVESQPVGVHRQECHGCNGHGDDRNASSSLRDRRTLSILGVS